MKISFFRWIDRIIGIILIIPIWIFSMPFPKAKLNPKKILIIKLWAMGECIITLPLIRALKKKYPKAQITVLARDRVRAVYTGSKDISEVKSGEFTGLLKLLSKFRKYDLVFDCEPYINESSLLGWWLGKRRIGFSHGIRSLLYTDKIKYNDKQHISLTYIDMAKPLGVTDKPKTLVPVATSRADDAKVNHLFKEWGISKRDKIVCIAPGAAETSRERIWPVKNFAKLADELTKEFLVKIIIVGSKGERKLADKLIDNMKYNAINAAGETNVKQLAALFKRCTLMIGNDSGPMHLSAAMGARTIGLFCPNTPVRWAPYGPGNDFVYKPVREGPCINTHLGQFPSCKGHGHMSNIKVEDVFNKARKILSR